MSSSVIPIVGVSQAYPFNAPEDLFTPSNTWVSNLHNATAGAPFVATLPLGFIVNMSVSDVSGTMTTRACMKEFYVDKPSDGIVLVGFVIAYSVGGEWHVADDVEIDLSQLANDVTVVLTTCLKSGSQGTGSKVLGSATVVLDTNILREISESGVSGYTTPNYGTVLPLGVSSARNAVKSAVTFMVDSPEAMVVDGVSGRRVTGEVIGSVILDGGYNYSVVPTEVPRPQTTTLPSTEVTFTSGAGLGYGFAPGSFCSDGDRPFPGVTPINGNIDIIGDDCHPVTMVNWDPDGKEATFMIFGECEACCKCSDYDRVAKAVGNIIKDYDIVAGKLDKIGRRSRFELLDELSAVLDRFSDVKVSYHGSAALSEGLATNKHGVPCGHFHAYMSINFCNPIYAELQGSSIGEFKNLRQVNITSVVVGTGKVGVFTLYPGEDATEFEKGVSLSIKSPHKGVTTSSGSWLPDVSYAGYAEASDGFATLETDATGYLNPGIALDVDISGFLFKNNPGSPLGTYIFIRVNYDIIAFDRGESSVIKHGMASLNIPMDSYVSGNKVD